MGGNDVASPFPVEVLESQINLHAVGYIVFGSIIAYGLLAVFSDLSDNQTGRHNSAQVRILLLNEIGSIFFTLGALLIVSGWLGESGLNTITGIGCIALGCFFKRRNLEDVRTSHHPD